MITWKDFQRLMPWEIVILVGGGYALAAGCKVLCMCFCARLGAIFFHFRLALGYLMKVGGASR